MRLSKVSFGDQHYDDEVTMRLMRSIDRSISVASHADLSSQDGGQRCRHGDRGIDFWSNWSCSECMLLNDIDAINGQEVCLWCLHDGVSWVERTQSCSLFTIEISRTRWKSVRHTHTHTQPIRRVAVHIGNKQLSVLVWDTVQLNSISNDNKRQNERTSSSNHRTSVISQKKKILRAKISRS